MQVANDEWTAVTATDANKIVAQNVGTTRIGFVLAGSAPNDADPVDDDSHGVLYPGSEPFTVTDLGTDGLTMYVRSLGPVAGMLYIS